MDITRTFDCGLPVKQVPDVVVDGVRYVPFTSNRISRALADRRILMNLRHPGMWSDLACTPGLYVTYKRAESLAVSVMGSL